jgi:hypothetical protein
MFPLIFDVVDVLSAPLVGSLSPLLLVRLLAAFRFRLSPVVLGRLRSVIPLFE